jgi:hypothetical protein
MRRLTQLCEFRVYRCERLTRLKGHIQRGQWETADLIDWLIVVSFDDYFSIIGPTSFNIYFQFIVINSLYIFLVFIFSSSGDAVYTIYFVRVMSAGC